MHFYVVHFMRYIFLNIAKAPSIYDDDVTCYISRCKFWRPRRFSECNFVDILLPISNDESVI